MQNKRKSDDTGRKPAANQSQSGNGKLTAAGKRQKVEKSSGGGNSAGADKNEKSTKSRREELLRQLKAVEDAIARKRSKIS